MKTLALAALSATLIAGCAVTPDDGSEPDFDDPNGKADGVSNPSGLYQVVDSPDAFGQGDDHIRLLDLRSGVKEI